MTLRQYSMLMSVATFLCWGAFFFVLAFMRPHSVGVMSVALFYTTAFAALAGTFSMVGLAVRRVSRPNELVVRQVATAFRQSLLLALLLVIVLVLQHAGTLSWSAFFFSAVGVSVLEFLLLNVRRERRMRRAVS